jgi:carbonyl reductase 1
VKEAMMTKRILITGANKGIGLATVAAILAHDDTHVLLGSRDEARGQAARETIVAEHPDYADRLEVVAIDVSRDDSVAAARRTIGEAPLHGIVNNAGVGIGSQAMQDVLNVNTRGPRRVFQTFLPLIADGGRVVNVSSASGPNFVANCSAERQQQLTHPGVTWAQIEALIAECLALDAGDFEAAGFGDGNAYGFSKACLNALTIELAREHPALLVNACTPGFIETDLTRPYAESSGKAPADMGMKSPAEGTKASLHLLLGEPGGSGWYFGSDAERSPLDRYRSPGDPPYQGD